MPKWIYLPILKWKQGERIALSKLTPAQRSGLLPVLELPAINSAHDGAALRSALPAYLAKVIKEMNNTFTGEQVVGVDSRWLAPGYSKQIALLAMVCKSLSGKVACGIVPVISETALMSNAADISKFDDHGAYVLRLQTTSIEPLQIVPLVKLATDNGLKKRNLHLVIDQFAIVKEDSAAKHAAVVPYIDAALAAQCSSVTVAGGSFPINLMGYKQGEFDIPRVEWRVWERLKADPAYKNLRFGDYTVTHPGPIPDDVDPTKMNPSVAIRYARDRDWKLYKAGGFKKGAPNQYRGLCNLLISDPTAYSGPAFSDGDDRYEKAAVGTIGNGNPSSWRRDATSHHLVFTADQLR